jgi:DnaJ-class molecular chaperone
MSHYDTLGVAKTATPEEIKRAYRKLASQHHPDKGGDTARFQEIEAAYRVLSDVGQRQQYDNPQPQFNDPFGPFMNTGGFGDIFRHFHQGFRQQQPQRNRTLNVQTTISLEDAFHGKELIANITLPSGKDQMVNVKIPAGIQDGTVLRLAGMGEDTIPNLPRGDIHLTITIQPHQLFNRQGDDLIQELTIPVWTAILGDSIKIRTIDNRELEVTIQPGTQFGHVLGVPGAGMPNMNDNRFKGRLLLKVNIQIPNNLNETQKNLLRQINS